MRSKVVVFDKRVSGYGLLANGPYWNSVCKGYRLQFVHGLVRPWRILRKIKGKNGWPWIGLGSGFKTKTDAIMAANKHKAGIPID